MNLVFLAALPLALAATPALAEVLTWDQAVSLARADNPDLLAARERVESARASHKARAAAFLPSVTADADYGRSGGDGETASDSYSAGLSVRQSLFAGLRDKAALERSRWELVSAEASLAAAAAQASFDLTTAFAGLLYAQEQLEVAETIAARRRENVRLVELRFEAGREHKGSMLRSRASHRQAEFEVAQARRARRAAERRLARVLGRDAFDELRAAGSLVYAPPPKSRPDFVSLAQRAPAYRIAEARRAAAETGVTIARSRFFPDLSARGGVSRAGSDWPPEDDRWSAGVALSFPLFSGGADAQGLRGARADRRAAEAEFVSARLRAALDLEEAFAGYENAVESVDVQRQFFEAARVRAEIARGQYTSGLLSFDDWDIIENEIISREKETLAARRQAVQANADWERVQGKGILAP